MISLPSRKSRGFNKLSIMSCMMFIVSAKRREEEIAGDKRVGSGRASHVDVNRSRGAASQTRARPYRPEAREIMRVILYE